MIEAVDEFFDTDDFAEIATYTNPAATQSTILVIFDSDHLKMNLGGQEIEMTGPAAICRTADVSTVNNKARLSIRSINYYVIEVMQSATGVTTLRLSKDPA